jgi:hypothetical protein
MGTSVPENIGRRSFYVRLYFYAFLSDSDKSYMFQCKPRAGAMVCPDEDRFSPILSDGEHARLKKALQTFNHAISSGSNIEKATALGLAASEAEAHAQSTFSPAHNLLPLTLSIVLIAGNADPPMEVEIFVYLEVSSLNILAESDIFRCYN